MWVGGGRAITVVFGEKMRNNEQHCCQGSSYFPVWLLVGGPQALHAGYVYLIVALNLFVRESPKKHAAINTENIHAL